MASLTLPKGSSIAKREELEAQQIFLLERAGTLAAEELAAKAEIADLRTQAQAAEVDAARQGQVADHSKRAARRRDLETRLDTIADTGRALRAAANRITAQIEELHCREFHGFAAAAGEQTRVATDALRALEQSYRAAYDAWQAATSAWEQPIADLSELPPGQDPVSVHKRGAARVCSPFPLPHPDEVFGGELPSPAPFGYVEKGERTTPKPGRYRSVVDGGEHVLADDRAVRSNLHQLTPDAYGFVQWRKVS